MPTALEEPNKELTPQMESHDVGGGGGEWEEKEEDGVKEKKEWLAAVALKGGELRVVESGTALRSLTQLHPCTTTTATPTPPPMLFTRMTSAPLWSSWNADFSQHPPPPCFSPYLLLQNKEE